MWQIGRRLSATMVVWMMAWTAQATELSDEPGPASSTNDTTVIVGTSEIEMKKTEDCLKHLHELLEKVTALHEAASTDRADAGRADCIFHQLVRMKGLVGAATASYAQLSQAIADSDGRVATAESANIIIACSRGERVLSDAIGCRPERPRGPKKTVVEPNVLPNSPTSVAHEPRIMPLPKKFPARDDRDCLRQEQLAVMVTRAMELELGANPSADACIAALEKLSIQPLPGWKHGRCATVDDLYVIASQVLHLKVDHPDDPAACAQALRDDGLAIDELLPARPPKGESPLLLESEAQAFLATGYAAPLPTSRRPARN